MNYTDEQFAALAPFEDNFRTAIDGEWTRRVRTPDQLRIKEIYEAATRSRIPFNQGCGTCLLNLLKRAGRLFFQDKEKRENSAAYATPQSAHGKTDLAPTIAPAPEAPEKAVKTPQISAQKPRMGKPSAKSNKGRKSAKK